MMVILMEKEPPACYLKQLNDNLLSGDKPSARDLGSHSARVESIRANAQHHADALPPPPGRAQRADQGAAGASGTQADGAADGMAGTKTTSARSSACFCLDRLEKVVFTRLDQLEQRMGELTVAVNAGDRGSAAAGHEVGDSFMSSARTPPRLQRAEHSPKHSLGPR